MRDFTWWHGALLVLILLAVVALFQWARAIGYHEGYADSTEDVVHAGRGKVVIDASALLAGVDAIQRWVDLHRTVEVHYLVDCVTIDFYSRDGDRREASVMAEDVRGALIMAGLTDIDKAS